MKAGAASSLARPSRTSAPECGVLAAKRSKLPPGEVAQQVLAIVFRLQIPLLPLAVLETELAHGSTSFHVPTGREAMEVDREAVPVGSGSRVAVELGKVSAPEVSITWECRSGAPTGEKHHGASPKLRMGESPRTGRRIGLSGREWLRHTPPS